MVLSAENVLLLGSVLLFVSILTSKTSFRFGIPTLILFLIVGMMAGVDGPGGIYFNDPKLARFLGIIALNFILFSGGLDTKWESVRPIFRPGLSLSTFGVLITGLLTGLGAWLVLDFTPLEGMLLGSIVASTDAAAVFSILRSRSIGLKGNLRPLLEFESGSNDPMAYFMTISFIELLLQPESRLISLIPRFLQAMTIGLVAGYLFGRVMTWVLNKIHLDVRGLYPVLVLSMVMFTFSFTEEIGGNGFLAVYTAAIFLGNSDFINKKSLMRFYDGQAWLMQIVMFLTLGLLVTPSEIIPIIPEGLLISLILMFVARPIAVFASLAFSNQISFRKKVFISWVGLRGAVPIIFATYPLLAGVSNAQMIFNIVFFISVSSVLLQGTTLTMVARWLHVSVPERIKRKFPVDIELHENSQSELVELDIANDSKAVGKEVVELKLPKTALIVLIYRKGRYMMASGDTIIQGGDHLLVMGDSKETIGKVEECLR
ncbi:MAG TPA: potassium/proton antiporter [Cyclobacteriaceae bacterium]|jgi:cell volume regulation protein A